MKTKNTLAMNGKTLRHCPLVFVLVLSLVLAFGSAQAFAKDGKNDGRRGGGYNGPGPALVTVEQATGMSDDSKVTLKGNIVQSLGGKRYMFKDATGSVTVTIGGKRWQGQNIGPDDLVEIYGEVDKEWNRMKIDVKRISKQ